MWLPRGLSGNGASIHGYGMNKQCTRKKPGGWLWRNMLPTGVILNIQNGCHRTEMAETQLPEHSGGSRWDHENGLPRGVPRAYEFCLSTSVVERYITTEINLLWQLGSSEKLHHVNSTWCRRKFFPSYFQIILAVV